SYHVLSRLQRAWSLCGRPNANPLDPRKPSGAREDPSWGRGRTPRGAAGGHLVGPRRVTGGFTAAVVVAEGERSEGHSRSHSVLRSDGCGSTTFTNVR
ncbi:unnamed protein product, partial [Lampetra planeri]